MQKSEILEDNRFIGRIHMFGNRVSKKGRASLIYYMCETICRYFFLLNFDKRNGIWYDVKNERVYLLSL